MASRDENRPKIHRQRSVPTQYHDHEGTGMPPTRPCVTMLASGQSVIFPLDSTNLESKRFSQTVAGGQWSSPRPSPKDNLLSTIGARSTQFPITSRDGPLSTSNIETTARDKTGSPSPLQPIANNNLSSTVGASPKQFPITSRDAICNAPNNDTASTRENVQYGRQLEETVKLNKILSRFNDKMKQDLAAKCSQLSVKFQKSDDDLVCVLKGSENLICDGKQMLERFEKELNCKKVYFAADVNEALHHLVVEKRINDRLFKRHPNCTAMQNGNEILVYGFNETEIGKALLFVGQMIKENKPIILFGDLRTRKNDIESHFQKKFGDELLVCVDTSCRLHLIGFKEALDEANKEFIDIKEGRILKDINHSKVPYEEKILYYQVRTSEIISFIEQDSMLKDIGKEFGVSIALHHKHGSIEIRGPSKNVQQAYEKIEIFEKNIFLTSIIFDNPEAVSYFKGERGNEYIDSIGHRFYVLAEKEMFFHVGKMTVTKQCFKQNIVWSVPQGRKLIIEKNSMENIQASMKVNPVLYDTRDRRFVCKGNTVTVGVPSFKDGNQSEESEMEYVWKTLLTKASEGNTRTVSIPIEPIALWKIEKFVRCLVKSCVHWLLDWPDNTPECVLLVTDNEDYFQKTDACVEELVQIWIKEMNTRPKICLIQAQLNQTEADVLVNTTSPNLDLSHGSVSAALSKQAGPGLQHECKDKYSSGIMHGMVAVTGGHMLMCKEVFHITLPQYNRDMKDCIESIRSTIIKCLYKASEHGFATIAFPVIGTGNLQYPEDIVVSEMFLGVERYRQECPFTTLKKVRFVIYPQDTALFEQFKTSEKRLLATPETSIEPRCEVKINLIGTRQNVRDAKAELDRKASTFVDRSTEETNRNRRNKLATTKGDRREEEMGISGDGNPSGKIVGPCRKRFSWSTDAEKVDAYETGNLVIRVYKADILNIPVEGIVNAANQDLRHVGGVALAIAKAAGEKNLNQECEKAIKNNKGPLPVTAVVCTSAGSLHFKQIIHAVGPRWSAYQPITDRSLRQCSDDLKQTITNCLMAAEWKGLESIVMPTVSSGRFGVPKEICAAQYAKSILEFSGKNDSLREVHIVDISDEMIDIVHKTFYTMFTAGKPPPSFYSRDYVDASVEGNRNMGASGTKSFNSTERDRPKSQTNNAVHREDSKKESLQHKSEGDDVDIDDHCVICMDTVTDAKRLTCGHTFCTECIDGYFRVKQVCPTCGKVCGTITGDQPDGTMHICKSPARLAGFTCRKSIVITYRFEHGKQGANHPKPGTFVKGITRSAYLPDNAEGREICAMLKIAFERRLVFTIGTSRTTGREGVITWNDIHHKTDIRPNTQFGYPDDTYLQRVREEIEAKGVIKEDLERKLLTDLEKDQFTLTVTSM